MNSSLDYYSLNQSYFIAKRLLINNNFNYTNDFDNQILHLADNVLKAIVLNISISLYTESNNMILNNQSDLSNNNSYNFTITSKPINIVKSSFADIINDFKSAIDEYTESLVLASSSQSQTSIFELMALQIGLFSHVKLGSRFLKQNQSNDLYEDAIKYNLSVVDFSNCELKLKEAYNISNNVSFIIKKIDFNSKLNLNYLNDSFGSNGTRFKIYNPIILELINASICNNITYNTKLALPDQLNLPKYFSLSSNDMDLLNSSSKAFQSRCYPHIDPATDADTSLNYRRTNYYLNKTADCGENCIYLGLDKMNYTICNCKPNQIEVSSTFTYSVLDTISSINYDIIICYNIFWKPTIYLNPAAYIVLVNFFLFAFISILIEFCKGDFQKDEKLFKKIILTDTTFFVREEMNIRMYFLYRKIAPKITLLKTKRLGLIKMSKHLQSFQLDLKKPELDSKNSRLDLEEINISSINSNTKINLDEEDDSLKGLKLIEKIYNNTTAFKHKFSLKDYYELTPFEAFVFDKRTFPTIIWDELRENHIVFTLFLKFSLIYPLWTRLLWIIYSLSVIFFLNALFFTDDYMDKRINKIKENRVKFTNI